MASGELRLVYTVSEAAELLGIGRSTAYDLIARGELATVRLASRSMVTRPTLTALLGMEPPLPGELDAMRAVLAQPLRPAPAPAPTPTPVRTRRRRSSSAAGDQSRLPFGA
jgi:excisionase family DNA binding protein